MGFQTLRALIAVLVVLVTRLTKQAAIGYETRAVVSFFIFEQNLTKAMSNQFL